MAGPVPGRFGPVSGSRFSTHKKAPGPKSRCFLFVLPQVVLLPQRRHVDAQFPQYFRQAGKLALHAHEQVPAEDDGKAHVSHAAEQLFCVQRTGTRGTRRMGVSAAVPLPPLTPAAPGPSCASGPLRFLPGRPSP
jgi:hypothetical protein